MSTPLTNPDSRPLPDGWNAHFDSQRGSWYYVQTNVSPPRVSYTHPLGLLSMPSPTIPSIVPLSPPQAKATDSGSVSQDAKPAVGLSFAQQLYASSKTGSRTDANGSMNSGQYYDAQPYTQPGRQLPPPPSPYSQTASSPKFVSPPPPPPLPRAPQEQRGEPWNPPYDNRHQHEQPKTNYNSYTPTSHYDSHSPHHAHHPNVHRSQSYAPSSASYHQHPQPHRASTFTSSSSSSTCPVTHEKPKELRTLTLTARPPPESIATSTNKADTALSTAQYGSPTTAYPSQSYSNNAMYGTSANAYTMPSAASYTVPNVPSYNPTPNLVQPQHQYMLQAPLQQPQAQQFYAQPATVQPEAEKVSWGSTAEGKAIKKFGLAVGKGAGKVALKMAGGAILGSAGLTPNLGVSGAVGSALVNGVFGGDIGDGTGMDQALGALISGISQMNTGDSNAQSASQGQSSLDYQSLLNAITQQQQQAPTQTQTPIDYQALLAQLQQMQAGANTNSQQQPGQQMVLQAQAAAQQQATQSLQLLELQRIQAEAQAQQLQQAFEQMQAQSEAQQALVSSAYQQNASQQQQLDYDDGEADAAAWEAAQAMIVAQNQAVAASIQASALF